MTFNIQHCINFLTRQIDFDFFAEAIRAADADIIGLQEVRGLGRDFNEYRPQAKILAEKLGYYYYFGEAIKFSGVNPYGNALLSRFPITAAETISIPDPEERKYKGYYETRAVIKSAVDVNGRPFNVFVSHFGLNPDEHELCVKTVLETVAGARDFVFMGDLNMTPDNPMICSIAARLHDTVSEISGDLLSFPSDNPDRKIDYIFTDPELKVLSCEILPVVVSDHRPVRCIIDF